LKEIHIEGKEEMEVSMDQQASSAAREEEKSKGRSEVKSLKPTLSIPVEILYAKPVVP
jgi:hypothetical protein